MLDVCSYVGGWADGRAGRGRIRGAVRGFLRQRAGGRRANAARNGLQLETRRGDAFDVLAALHAEGRRFDVLVVDPPAFVKRRKDLPKGEAAYRKLNQLALQLASDEALLVSCSCSWHLPAEHLPELLQSAAAHAGRSARHHRAGRTVARSSGASGHARDALPQGPVRARIPVESAPMLTYPDIDPIALHLGPLKIHWYGIMYVIGFAAAWWLAPAPGKAARQHLEARAGR